MARPKKLTFDENDKQLLLGSFIPEANRLIDIRVRMTAAMTRLTNATAKHASMLKDLNNVERIIIHTHNDRYSLSPSHEVMEVAMKELTKDIEHALKDIQSIAKEIIGND